MPTTEIPNFLIFLMFASITLNFLTNGEDPCKKMTVKTVFNIIGTLGIIICVYWITLISLGVITY